jgi:hypothetical protein
MRGRLIQRFKARLYLLNTQAQEAAQEYDSVLREPIKIDTAGDGIGSLARRETVITVPCQVGNRRYENRQQTNLGNDPDADFVLYFFAKDLEAVGLFDPATGKALIQVATRLGALLHKRTEAVVLDFTGENELFCEECEPSGWGLCMADPKRNLSRAVFSQRQKRVA